MDNPSSNYFYDSTLRKLSQILKINRSDSLKQLEDLWDTISKPQIIQNAPSPGKPVTSPSRLSPTPDEFSVCFTMFSNLLSLLSIIFV